MNLSNFWMQDVHSTESKIILNLFFQVSFFQTFRENPDFKSL